MNPVPLSESASLGDATNWKSVVLDSAVIALSNGFATASLHSVLSVAKTAKGRRRVTELDADWLKRRGSSLLMQANLIPLVLIFPEWSWLFLYMQ
tara:strand:+ start:1303 stop:1587 length:285 start_codon:yes stop_codon:yes gene_type:complete